jgi:hypothetical protein
MNNTRMGWLLVGIGVVVLAASALADPLGIGEGSGFGWKQVVGIIVGAVVAASGAVVLRRSSLRRSESHERGCFDRANEREDARLQGRGVHWRTREARTRRCYAGRARPR